MSLHERRLAGAAGILFSVLSLAVMPLSPEVGPPVGSSASDLVGYFVRHRTGFLIGNYLGIAAFFPGFIQLAIVTSWIRRREEPHGWLGTLVFGTGTFAYSAGATVLMVFQVLPFLANGSREDSAAAFVNLANVSFCLFSLVGAPFLGALGWATLATRIFPRWLGLASLVMAAALIVMSLGALTTEPHWLAAGGLATVLGFAGFFSVPFAYAIASFRAEAK